MDHFLFVYYDLKFYHLNVIVVGSLFYSSGLSLCLSVDHFYLVPVDDMVLLHGGLICLCCKPQPFVIIIIMVCDGCFVSYTALPCHGGSGLSTSCERVHFFLAFLDPQTELPACLSNRDQFGLLFIPDLVLRMNHKVP